MFMFMLVMLSVLTMVITDRSGSCPVPRGGAVPLGRPILGEPFLAGEALRHPNTEPLFPGPEVTVIQLELSRTKHIWEREREMDGQRRRMEDEERSMQERREGWEHRAVLWQKTLCTYEIECITIQNITFACGMWHQSATGQSHGRPLPISTAEPVADRERVSPRAAVIGQHTAFQPFLERKHMVTSGVKLSNMKLSSKKMLICFTFQTFFFIMTIKWPSWFSVFPHFYLHDSY